MGWIMTDIKTIFDKLGGIQSVATLIGCKYSSAAEMKRRQIIPVKFWPKLIEGSKAKGIRGVNAAVLLEIHTREDK